MHTLKLISIYYHVYDKYKEDLCQHVLRLSTNRLEGRISDEEIITIYLFCKAYEQKYTVKAMYDHIDRYWRSWFPDLPSYQAFNARLNRISQAFPHLVASLCEDLGLEDELMAILLGDSMPIVTCAGSRKGKVARPGYFLPLSI